MIQIDLLAPQFLLLLGRWDTLLCLSVAKEFVFNFGICCCTVGWPSSHAAPWQMLDSQRWGTNYELVLDAEWIEFLDCWKFLGRHEQDQREAACTPILWVQIVWLWAGIGLQIGKVFPWCPWTFEGYWHGHEWFLYDTPIADCWLQGFDVGKKIIQWIWYMIYDIWYMIWWYDMIWFARYILLNLNSKSESILPIVVSFWGILREDWTGCSFISDLMYLQHLNNNHSVSFVFRTPGSWILMLCWGDVNHMNQHRTVRTVQSNLQYSLWTVLGVVWFDLVWSGIGIDWLIDCQLVRSHLWCF